MTASRDPERRKRQLANLRPAPPAPEGNTRALRHNGYGQVDESRLDARRREIADLLAQDAPVSDRADTATISLLAECLCRLEGVREYVDEHGVVRGKAGRVLPAAELERRLRHEARTYLDELGMTTRSRAKLGLTIASAHNQQASALRTMSTEELQERLTALRANRPPVEPSDPTTAGLLEQIARVRGDDD